MSVHENAFENVVCKLLAIGFPFRGYTLNPILLSFTNTTRVKEQRPCGLRVGSKMERQISTPKVLGNVARMSVCILFVFHQITTIYTQSCKPLQIRKQRENLRCVTALEQYTKLSAAPRRVCTTECLRRTDCSLTNYNHVHNYCLMTSERCVKLAADVEFQVTHFGTTAENCVFWEKLAHYQQALTIFFPTVDNDIVPGRYVFPTGKIPGKLYPHDNNLYVVKDGVLYYGTDQKEVLQIVPECHVTWVDYTAGDDLPEGAVVGGTWGGATLYVIKGDAGGGYIQCGYYHSTDAKGFVENNGVKQLTNMEMLIVLWLVEHLWWTDDVITWKRFCELLALCEGNLAVNLQKCQ